MRKAPGATADGPNTGAGDEKASTVVKNNIMRIVGLGVIPANAGPAPEELSSPASRSPSPPIDPLTSDGGNGKGGKNTRERLYRESKVKFNLGKAYVKTRQLDRASDALRTALMARRMLFGPESVPMAEVHELMGDLALLKDGEGGAIPARRHYGAARRVCEAELSMAGPKSDSAEVKQMLERVVTSLEGLPDEDGSGYGSGCSSDGDSGEKEALPMPNLAPRKSRGRTRDVVRKKSHAVATAVKSRVCSSIVKEKVPMEDCLAASANATSPPRAIAGADHAKAAPPDPNGDTRPEHKKPREEIHVFFPPSGKTQKESIKSTATAATVVSSMADVALSDFDSVLSHPSQDDPLREGVDDSDSEATKEENIRASRGLKGSNYAAMVNLMDRRL